MKVYEIMKSDCFRTVKRVVTLTSKAKACGYLTAILAQNPRAVVIDNNEHFLYSEKDTKITAKNVLNRRVVNRGEFGTPEYSVKEIEVL